MRSRTRVVALVAGLLLLLGTAAVAAAPTTPVACSITSNTLMCPLPAPVKTTVTKTVTKTVTATPTATTAPPTSTSAPTTTTATTTSAPPTTTTTPPAPGGTIVLGRSFPNADTTGVPAGTVLTPYTGPCTITTPNVVIDSKTVTCDDLRIYARGIVIKNSVINNRVYADYNENLGSFTISDSEVRLPLATGTGIGDAYFTATRVEVTGGNRSINCYAECTVQDSYVHGQYEDTRGLDHESGIRVNTNSHLVHNTIGCTANDYPPDAGCSAAITGYADFDPVTGNTIENNLILAGSGGYCAYGGSTPNKPASGQEHDIVFRDNIWQRGTEPGDAGRGFVCGFWGPITSFDITKPGAVWTNNLYDDGTVVDPAN